MGQTLTHGVYLPNEGERNCYSGLASNWRLLDGAIGTVAAHTTAIAGKADISHTHGNITNDGKVGTDANKPLITGTGGVVQAGSFGTSANTFCEGNDSRLSDARTPVAHTHGRADITDLFNSANTWTAVNTFTGHIRPIRLQGSDEDIYNVQPQSVAESQIGFVDKNNKMMSYITFQHRPDATETHRLCLRQNRITVEAYYGVNLNNLGDFYPEQYNAINLGTSTNKWKTLNGVNPGALSLPSGAAENINTDNWNFSWNANTITAPFDGYISIACFGSALQINNETKSYAMTYAPGSDGFICGLLPVSSGDSIKVLVTRTQTSIYEGYKFIKASGNVS